MLKCDICEEDTTIRYPSPLDENVRVCGACKAAIEEAAPAAQGYAEHRERRAAAEAVNLGE